MKMKTKSKPAAKIQRQKPKKRNPPRSKINKPLAPNQARFVEEYLIDLNATAAAERAGYADKNCGRQLMMRPNVKLAVLKAMGTRSEKMEIKAETTLRELANVAFSDIGEVMDFTGDTPKLKPAWQISEKARRALASVKVSRFINGTGEDAKEVEVTEFKFWDKLSALEKLCKHLGLFIDRVDMTGEIEHKHIHAHVSVESLGLSLETKKQILEAIRRKKSEMQISTIPIPDKISQIENEQIESEKSDEQLIDD